MNWLAIWFFDSFWCKMWGRRLKTFCVPTESCLILCHPMDCSPPGSSVRGILQARILERAAISSSRSFQPRDWTTLLRLVHWQVGSFSLHRLGSLFISPFWCVWGDISHLTSNPDALISVDVTGQFSSFLSSLSVPSRALSLFTQSFLLLWSSLYSSIAIFKFELSNQRKWAWKFFRTNDMNTKI